MTWRVYLITRQMTVVSRKRPNGVGAIVIMAFFAGAVGISRGVDVQSMPYQFSAWFGFALFLFPYS